MPTDPGPYQIDSTRLVLTPGGDALPRAVTPDFFERLGELGDFAGHVLVMRFDFDEPWSTWEMHPAGDELVYLLSGDVDFHLRGGAREQVVRVDEPGSYVVVPRGVWHTARPHAPTAMLFVTPGQGTENRETPP